MFEFSFYFIGGAVFFHEEAYNFGFSHFSNIDIHQCPMSRPFTEVLKQWYSLSITPSFHIRKRNFPSSITRLFSGRAYIGKVGMHAPFILFFTNFWNNKLVLCICQQLPFIILLSIWTHELNILDVLLFIMFFSILMPNVPFLTSGSLYILDTEWVFFWQKPEKSSIFLIYDILDIQTTLYIFPVLDFKSMISLRSLCLGH